MTHSSLTSDYVFDVEFDDDKVDKALSVNQTAGPGGVLFFGGGIAQKMDYTTFNAILILDPASPLLLKCPSLQREKKISPKSR